MTVTCSVDIHKGAADQTPPQYFQMLRACALKQTIHGSTGVSLVTDARYDNVPATIEVVERDEGASPVQVVVKAHGCMGNPKLVLDTVGNPVRIDFEFKGVYNGVSARAFGSIIEPTGFDTALPDAVLSATISLMSETQKLDKLTIDLGNVVEIFTDPSKAEGLEGARVVDRNPTMEIDPDLLPIGTKDYLTLHLANTTGAFSRQMADFTISAPAAQLIATYKPGEREGHVVNNITCELKRSVGNDELEILQGSKT